MEIEFVIYQGEEYRLLHQYDSGYCEINKDESLYSEIKLVHISELSSKGCYNSLKKRLS